MALVLSVLVLLEAGCRQDTQGGTAVLQLKPTAQLVRDIPGLFPNSRDGTTYSNPIPVLSGGRLSLAVFRYSSGTDWEKNGVGMDAPERVMYLDPETGALLREEPLPPAPSLGTERFDMSASEYLELTAKLYGAYDKLLPAFARQEKDPSPEVRAAANTFAELFPRFAGKLLKPYYDRIGKDWFSWIESITERSRPR
jgi:hypothetical protein